MTSEYIYIIWISGISLVWYTKPTPLFFSKGQHIDGQPLSFPPSQHAMFSASQDVGLLVLLTCYSKQFLGLRKRPWIFKILPESHWGFFFRTLVDWFAVRSYTTWSTYSWGLFSLTHMNDKSGRPFFWTSLHISSFLTMKVVFVVLVGAVVVVAVVV